jgi:O-acetyl-ADP-ribose deacetylase (regulator of RNase III)
MTKKAEKEKGKENSPVFSKRLGAISATVFENQTDERTYFNIQVTRRYKASDGAWHDSSVLNGEADVTHLIEVLSCTNRFLQERAMQSTDEE